MAEKYGEINVEGVVHKTLIHVDYEDTGMSFTGFSYRTHQLIEYGDGSKFAVEFYKKDKTEFYSPRINFDCFEHAEIFVSGFLSCIGMRKMAGFING